MSFNREGCKKRTICLEIKNFMELCCRDTGGVFRGGRRLHKEENAAQRSEYNEEDKP